MKKILLFIFFAILTVSVTAQEKVLIRTYNGEIKKFNMWDVEQIEFIVEDDPTNYAIPGIVDLGLSVKWASFNLGANTITGTGRLFGWGALYDSMNSKLPVFYPSATPPESIVASNYDVAKVKLGDLWRMPTTEEIQELIDSCDWEWSVDSVGWIVKRNDNKIFLPVTYYRNGDDINTTTLTGNYWSGSLAETGTNANQLYFSDSDSCTIKPNSRWLGFAIRPVFGEYVPATKLSLEAIDVTFSSLTAKIRIEGALDNVEESGLLYGTNASLDINSASKLLVENISEENLLTLNALSFLTTYYIKAYIKVNGEYIYSDEISVKTKAQYPVADMVDLGLSVKWASWNMGANRTADYGKYYCWNDPYNNGSATNTELTNIAATDFDMAHVQWKEEWRMPTKADWKELRDTLICTWEYVSNYEGTGISGQKVTSKKTGNSIFLPYSGKYDIAAKDFYKKNRQGFYWTANSKYENNQSIPFIVGFDGNQFVDDLYSTITDSIPLRPVYGPITSISEPEEKPEENDGYVAVDLGLTNLWSTKNLCAKSVEDSGKYFFWGDRDTTRTDFTFTTEYDSNIPKNLQDTDYDYDVVRNVLGKEWMIPSTKDMAELATQCDWEWTEINGVSGYKVSSRYNSNYIFLPACGRNNSNSIQFDKEGYYWTCEVFEENEYAYCLNFSEGGTTLPRYSQYRNYGMNIRPIKKR